MLSFPRFPLPKKAFCCYWIKPVKIPADIHPFCSARSNRSIKSKAKPSRAPFCASQSSPTSRKPAKRSKPLYKKGNNCFEDKKRKGRKASRLITNFWVARPKKSAAQMLFLWDPSWLKSITKISSMCKKGGSANYSAKAKEPLPNPKHLIGYPSGLHAILFSKDK